MVQNHLFQILSIMAMEQPEEFSPKGCTMPSWMYSAVYSRR